MRFSVKAWATDFWGKTFGSEHGASGDNLKANEGRKAGEDGELHVVEMWRLSTEFPLRRRACFYPFSASGSGV